MAYNKDIGNSSSGSLAREDEASTHGGVRGDSAPGNSSLPTNIFQNSEP